ncbi:MAG TPA: hypothetical protein VF152_04150 [Acidimicrobiia bacterium]
MRRDRHRLLTVTVVLVALVTLGAGSSDERVRPARWAKAICTALSDWAGAIATAQRGVDPEEPDLRERRRVLVEYLDSVAGATRTLLGEFKQAGIPDVDDGKPIARAFRQGVREARDAFAAAADDVAALQVADTETFEQGQNDVYEQIQEARGDAAAPFTEVAEKYDTAKLDAAFEKESACSGSG